MPTVWTDAERREHQERAARLYANGHRLRGWLVRLGLTELRDVLRGRVWPNGDLARDLRDLGREGF